MITLTAAQKAQKNTLSAGSDGPWLWLVDLDRDGTNHVYLAKNTEDVTFNSLTWSASNMTIQPASSDSESSTKNFIISIQNVDQTMVTYLEAGELLNYPVELHLVHADALSSSSNRITTRGIILSADANETVVSLTCGAYNLRALTVPSDIYSRERCRWRFKSTECGYAGGESTCTKDIDDCEDNKNNKSRFGGFKSMPMQRP